MVDGRQQRHCVCFLIFFLACVFPLSLGFFRMVFTRSLGRRAPSVGCLVSTLPGTGLGTARRLGWANQSKASRFHSRFSHLPMSYSGREHTFGCTYAHEKLSSPKIEAVADRWEDSYYFTRNATWPDHPLSRAQKLPYRHACI